MVGKWTNEPCNGVDEVVNTFWVLTTGIPSKGLSKALFVYLTAKLNK